MAEGDRQGAELGGLLLTAGWGWRREPGRRHMPTLRFRCGGLKTIVGAVINLIDRVVFGDNVTQFMTEALICHHLRWNAPRYWNCHSSEQSE